MTSTDLMMGSSGCDGVVSSVVRGSGCEDGGSAAICSSGSGGGFGAVEDLEPASPPPWSSNKTRTSKNNRLRNESRTCLDNDSMRGSSVTICT
jgi:hypothetical protein